MKLKEFFKKRRKPILISGAVVLAAAIGCGIWYYLGHNSSEPVYVYPFEYVGMTEYWGDTQESYGPVTTDKIQTVFLAENQTVTEVLVQPGDRVKKGDLLMTLDTTLSDLAMERKRLEVEKLKLQLQDAKEQLRQISMMKPMILPDFTPEEKPEEEENLGSTVNPGNPQIGDSAAYDGSSPDKAILCWINSADSINDALLEQVRQKAEDLWNRNEEAKYNASGDGEEGEEKPPYQAQTMTKFYVVIKSTEENRQLAPKTVWQGLEVSGQNAFSFRFCDAVIPDYTLGDLSQEEELPEIDFGSGFTAAQIAEMRAEQEKKIKDLEFQVKMAEANYQIAQTESNDGKIYAQIDGEVVSVLSEEEARMQMQPVMKVSGGGGFYVEGFVSELEKDRMYIGMEVTVNDWNTGMTYTGTVASLGDFPNAEGYWNGMGNPTASYYPFNVFVDGSADLQAGRYVSVMYSTSTGENGIYLQKPFLRTENGKSYVYIMGEDGRLEQRFVTTGKDLYGSYTEILAGLTAEDLVAFPYGKNVKDGAAAVEGDMSNLYG
jgi:multidrug efflux pump subunit AcrA (membrane-fusion protein)